MDKEGAVYACSGILLSHEKEGNPAVDNKLDEAWEHFAKWNKLVLDEQHPYYSTSMSSLK